MLKAIVWKIMNTATYVFLLLIIYSGLAIIFPHNISAITKTPLVDKSCTTVYGLPNNGTYYFNSEVPGRAAISWDTTGTSLVNGQIMDLRIQGSGHDDHLLDTAVITNNKLSFDFKIDQDLIDDHLPIGPQTELVLWEASDTSGKTGCNNLINISLVDLTNSNAAPEVPGLPTYCGVWMGQYCLQSNSKEIVNNADSCPGNPWPVAGGANEVQICCNKDNSCPSLELNCGDDSPNQQADCQCVDTNGDNSPYDPISAGGNYCCGWVSNGQCYPTPVVDCGKTTYDYSDECYCNSQPKKLEQYAPIGNYCCGWVDGGTCSATEPANTGGSTGSTNTGGSTGTTGSTGQSSTTNGGTGGSQGAMDIFEGPTSDTFRSLNPLNSNKSSVANDLDSPGEIVSRILLFAFPLAGLILFAMIVWGGFEMIIGATGKGIEAGRQRVTAAVIGFLLLFASYWIMQIVEYIFGVVIL